MMEIIIFRKRIVRKEVVWNKVKQDRWTGEQKTDSTDSATVTDNIANTAETEPILVHHYNHISSTTNRTNELGEVVEEYSYGTYGELLSGDVEKTAYLYNGLLGVATDKNGINMNTVTKELWGFKKSLDSLENLCKNYRFPNYARVLKTKGELQNSKCIFERKQKRN